jgi:hypothetical protein
MEDYIMNNFATILTRLSHWHYISRDLLEHDLIHRACEAVRSVPDVRYVLAIWPYGDTSDILADRATRYLTEREIQSLIGNIVREAVEDKSDSYDAIIKHLSSGKEDNEDLIAEYAKRITTK